MVRERARVVLDGHALVTTNTYFGRFPAAYWQRWTSVQSVEVGAVVSGDGLIRVLASDSRGEPRTVAVHRVNGAHSEQVRLPVAIDKFVDGGALWLEFQTTTAGMTVEQVRWSVGATRARRATAVVICTFNRADDCLATLQTLASDTEVAGELSAVYVVDQGTDTVESREGFREVSDALGPVLRYLRQPNLGGAGGVTPGIYETGRKQTSAPGNLPPMDDDNRPEPHTGLPPRGLAHPADQPPPGGGHRLDP